MITSFGCCSICPGLVQGQGAEERGWGWLTVAGERGGLAGNASMWCKFSFFLRKYFLSSECQGMYSAEQKAAFVLPGYLLNENTESLQPLGGSLPRRKSYYVCVHIHTQSRPRGENGYCPVGLDTRTMQVMVKPGPLASFGDHYCAFKIQDISLSQKRQPECRHSLWVIND